VFILSNHIQTRHNNIIVGAIKVAAKEISECKDPDKRWAALQELRKLQKMIV
jgi:hypothetical protein